MDYEHFVVAAARVVELTGVVVMLAGALVASLAYGRRLMRRTPHHLGVLAVIVAIRTLLSFALELEVSGRWPWQRPPPAP